jgi:GNAT superfamily N-acetyltransferase
MPEAKSKIRAATAQDVPAILDLIRALAEFEKLSHEVVATEAQLTQHLFGAKPAAEVLICEVEAESGWKTAGFALFFTSFSTFLGLPGIYLEDLFIRPELRSGGLGKQMLSELARLTVKRGYGRLEWSVLDWNVRARKFYEEQGAKPMDEWTVHRVTGVSLRELAGLPVSDTPRENA